MVRLNCTINGIYTWIILIFTVTGFKGSVLGIVGRVIGTANPIQLVLAKLGVVRLARIAGFETKGVPTNETMISM